MTGDVEEYLAAAGDFLRSRPTENTVVLSATATLRASGPAAFGEAAPLFGWWQADGEQVAGAFMQTPPFPVVLTRMPDDAVTALAGTLAAAELLTHAPACTGLTSSPHRDRLPPAARTWPPRPTGTSYSPGSRRSPGKFIPLAAIGRTPSTTG
jgi:hypothetical protein